MPNAIRMTLVLVFMFSFSVCVAPLVAQELSYKDYTEDLKIPDVVARVNGVGVRPEYIKFKFNRLMKRLDQQFSQRPDGDQVREKVFAYDEKKKAVMDFIDKAIVRELMYQQAKKQEKIPDPKAVARALAQLREAYKTQGAFDNELQRRGLTLGSLNFNLGVDYLIQQLVQESIQSKITISDEAVKMFYEEHKDRFKRPEAYRVRHIFVPHFTREMIQGIAKDQLEVKQEEFSQQAKANMEKILEEIRAGADFSEMAKKFSQDEGSASKGGDLDFIYKGVFPGAFDDTVSKLKLNEFSDVVKTPFGYHLIRLLETKPPELAPFGDLKESIQKHLFIREGQKKLQVYIDDLRKDAEVKMLY